jgi:hypothetical protein
LSYPTKANDQNAAIIQRLDQLGYEVGYRWDKVIKLTAIFVIYRMSCIRQIDGKSVSKSQIYCDWATWLG